VRALRNRIRKPPVVPAIELRRHAALPGCDDAAETQEPVHLSKGSMPDAQSDALQQGTGSGDEGTSPRVHEASVEDVDRADTLTLEDFETDFSRVDIPEDSPLTTEQLQTAVTNFLDTLEIGGPHGR
jgi:hypothetical protein